MCLRLVVKGQRFLICTGGRVEAVLLAIEIGEEVLGQGGEFPAGGGGCGRGRRSRARSAGWRPTAQSRRPAEEPARSRRRQTE